MNSDNITYIFGAGASCKSQPLVIDMKERMVCLLDLLNVECDLHQNHIHSDFKDKTNDLYIKYKPIVEEAIKHYTPDTYAKKLYLKSNSEIEIFKEFLDLYFLFEQDTEKVVYNTFPDDPYPHSPINLDDIVAFPIQKRKCSSQT
ncbi:MAG: hypothetical protein IPF52_18230 [Saprospiraceae bacterium]|nr:hypothetical protein [Saprospiraceae bacterium]